MTDITAPLTELRAAYRALQSVKRDKKEEITEKYRARIEDEIRAAVEAERYAFAKRLRDMKDEYGLRVTDIQDHVLRTRNWKVWEDLRDYADIAPEQVLRDNAREEKKRKESGLFNPDQYRIDPSAWTNMCDWFVLLTAPDGSDIELPFSYHTVGNTSLIPGGKRWEEVVSEHFESRAAAQEFVNPTIQKLLATGDLAPYEEVKTRYSERRPDGIEYEEGF